MQVPFYTVLLLLHLVPFLQEGCFIIIIIIIILFYFILFFGSEGENEFILLLDLKVFLSLSLSTIFIMKFHQCPLGLCNE